MTKHRQRHAEWNGRVAQWIRHRSTEPEIVGSSPTVVTQLFTIVGVGIPWSAVASLTTILRIETPSTITFFDWQGLFAEKSKAAFVMADGPGQRSRNGNKNVRLPGIEPGPAGWKPAILTTRPQTLSPTADTEAPVL